MIMLNKAKFSVKKKKYCEKWRKIIRGAGKLKMLVK